MTANLDAVFDRKCVKGVIFQMVGNSFGLAFGSGYGDRMSFMAHRPSEKVVAALFERFRNRALELQGDYSTKLHQLAQRIGAAQKLGPAALYASEATQASVFAPFFATQADEDAVNAVLASAAAHKRKVTSEWATWEETNNPPYLPARLPQDPIPPVTTKVDILLACLSLVTATLGRRLQSEARGFGAGVQEEYGTVTWPPFKTMSRKHVKALGDYSAHAAPWACILDDLRLSVVSETAKQQARLVEDILGGRMGADLTPVRAKSTMDDPTAQVKNELWNLRYAPRGMTFASMMETPEWSLALREAKTAHGEAIQHVWAFAVQLLESKHLASLQVATVIELQLYRREFIDAKKRSHLFYKIGRAENLAELAKDCFPYSSAGPLAYSRQSEIDFEARNRRE